MKKLIIIMSLIVALEIGGGVGLSFAISNAVDNSQRNWASAIKTDTAEGYYSALNEECEIYVYGKMVAIDPVAHENIKGEYAYIEEEYQHKNGDDEWHTRETKEWHCKKFKFYDDEYAYGNIRKPSVKYNQERVKEDSRNRYQYNTVPASFKGVLHIEKDGSYSFHPNSTLESMKPINIVAALVFFWIGWVAVMVFLDWLAYCYVEENWC